MAWWLKFDEDLWFSVTDGVRWFETGTISDAEWLCDLLNAQENATQTKEIKNDD